MSKKLDDELAQALSLAEQQDTPAVVKPAAASPAPECEPTRTKLRTSAARRAPRLAPRLNRPDNSL